MEDQDDFTFDEQDSDSEEWYEEEEPKRKRGGGGSRSRLLLLLLLLVVLAGGAYYYFMILPMDSPGPAAPPKAVVKMPKKPINMPAKQKISTPAPAPEPTEQVAGNEQTTDPQAAPAKAPAAKPASQEVAPAEKPVAESDKADQPAPEPKPDSKKVFATQPAKQADAADGVYTLTAGTYLLDSSVRSVSKKIRALGYQPVLTPVKRKVDMTRLKVGTYPVSEAAARKAELKPIAPGVFGIRKGDMETVYAGSFLVLDKARRYADKLYVKGIKVEEVPTQVEQTLQRITFGSFATSGTASDAGRQAAAEGLEAEVTKKR